MVGIRRGTRVAVAQIAFHPAAVLDRRVALEDPLFDLTAPELLRFADATETALGDKLPALRGRVRDAFLRQWQRKVQAIVEHCLSWAVQLLVLPEYSVPWQRLEWLASISAEMVVVAGTHTVERAARQSGVYERLGIYGQKYGEALCVVLHRGRAIASQPKLHPATPELRSMARGDRWAPIAMPDSIGSKMGVLICKDFLVSTGLEHAESESSSAPKLETTTLRECRFLAVPSLTPTHSLEEFGSTAWQSAERYRSPVLYANIADGGGTSIFVDEDRVHDLQRFPERVGLLPRGDEGVIVADVDLGYERTSGKATPFDERRPVRPFAAASLLYTSHPVASEYSAWLADLALNTSPDDDASCDALVERMLREKTWIEKAASLPNGAMRTKRLRELLRTLDRVQSVEELRTFTREIVLPPEAISYGATRSAVARGVSDLLFEWKATARGLDDAFDRASGAGKASRELSELEWTEAGRAEVSELARSVRGEVPKAIEPTPVIERVVRAPDGIHPASLPLIEDGQWQVAFFESMERLPTKAHVRVIDQEAIAVNSRLTAIPAWINAELLHRARGATKLAAVELSEHVDTHDTDRACLLVWEADDWILEHDEGFEPQRLEILLGLLAKRHGIAPRVRRMTTADEIQAASRKLVTRLDGGSSELTAHVAAKLRETHGQWVEPLVTVDERKIPALEALNQWLTGPTQNALLLGEFGTGKSTLLAKWCASRWEAGTGPRPLFASLAGAGAEADPLRLLLDSVQLPDVPENRAVLRLLLRTGNAVAVFDGFDEMATRVSPDTHGARLSALLGVGDQSGRVLISSRDNYFSSESALTNALVTAFGKEGSYLRMYLELLDRAQIERLVRDARGDDASAALDKIASTYDLRDLVERPLLLAMVLETLDDFEAGARVARADVYERYLDRWLQQTHSNRDHALSDSQKRAFAEALAEQLWRTGRPSCSWDELRQSVRERIGPELPDDVPPAHAMNDVCGSAFFVRDDEDRYRFAHKSFLEYFLARSLVRTLPERVAEALDTRPITAEVASFVGEVLRASGDSATAPSIRALHEWLQNGRDDESLEATANAAANAIRLLKGLANWSGTGEKWFVPRMDLRRVDLSGESWDGLALDRVRLDGARLVRTRWIDVDARAASLNDTVLDGSVFERVILDGSTARRASWAGVGAREVSMNEVDAREAKFEDAVWVRCSWIRAKLLGARLTRSVVPGASGTCGSSGTSPYRTAIPLRHSGNVQSLSLTPDGTQLASAGDDGTIRVWRTSDGAQIAELWGHQGVVSSVSYSPDGTQIVSAGDDGTIRVWRASDGAQIAELRGYSGAVRSVRFSPDGAKIVSGGHAGRIRAWRASDGAQISKVRGHSGVVSSVSYSPDGTQIVSAGEDGTIGVWRASNGTQIEKLRGHLGPVWFVSYSPDGARIASAGNDGTIRVWRVSERAKSSQLRGHSGVVRSVHYSPDGTQLASAGDDGTIRVWRTSDGAQISELRGHEGSVRFVCYSPDGTQLVSAGVDRTIRVWRTSDGAQISELRGYSDAAQSAIYSPDGTQIVNAGDDGTIRVWGAFDGVHVSELQGHSGAVRSVCYSPDGMQIISAGVDGTIRVWRTADRAQISQIRAPSRAVRSVCEWPDGTRIVSAGDDGTPRVWRASDGAQIAEYQKHLGSVRFRDDLSDEMQAINAYGDRTIRMWRTSDRAQFSEPRHIFVQGRLVSYSPDGTLLVSARKDGTIRVWRASDGAQISEYRGHEGPLRFVSWSPDGTRIVSAGDDGTIRVWRTSDGAQISKLGGKWDGIRSVSFSREETQVVGIDAAGVIHVLRVSDSVCLYPTDTGGLATSGPFFHGDAQHARLAWTPETAPNATFYLPIEPLRSLLERPDEVARALAGQPPAIDIAAELAALGITGSSAWNGLPVILSDDTDSPPSTPSLVTTSSATAFTPGAALDTEALPGRTSELASICALLEGSPASSVALIGPRRAGKTSLLHAIARRFDASRVRSITLEGRTNLRSRTDLARLLAPELADHTSPADAILDALRPLRPVFLLDEMAHLLALPPEDIGWLRTLSQRCGPVVLAGSPQDWTLLVRHANKVPGSSFGNDLSPFVLGPLPARDARSWLAERIAPTVPDRDRWIDALFERCGTWPFYLQVLGFALDRAIAEGDFKAVQSSEGLSQFVQQRLLVERSHVFQGRWRELPRTVKRLLLDHPEGRPAFTGLTDEAQIDLAHCGLCSVSGDWLHDPPFFDWVLLYRRVLEHEFKSEAS